MNSTLALPSGTYTWSNFDQNLVGLDASGRAGLVGAGSDHTILEMAPYTSTKAAVVPTAAGTTNNLTQLRFTGSPVLSGFTLLGTPQGHLYSGIDLHKTTGARVSDVKVVSVPGDWDSPPGETSAVSDYRGVGSVFNHVEIDGTGGGAAGFSTTDAQNVEVDDSYFHDSVYSHGATFWQTTNVTVKNTTSTNNYRAGFNFERVSGDVLLSDITTSGNKLADIRIGNDEGSARFTIVNPHFTGSKLRIMLTPQYMNRPNLQLRSDIHVIINGQDRTDDVVEWVTHW